MDKYDNDILVGLIVNNLEGGDITWNTLLQMQLGHGLWSQCYH
jgi:hypothetical protein